MNLLNYDAMGPGAGGLAIILGFFGIAIVIIVVAILLITSTVALIILLVIKKKKNKKEQEAAHMLTRADLEKGKAEVRSDDGVQD